MRAPALVLCGVLVSCGGQTTRQTDEVSGPDGPPQTCLTSTLCAEGSYCHEGRCISAATRCPTTQEPVEIEAARGLKTALAWIVNFRGQEVIWSLPTPEVQPLPTLTPVDGGQPTTIPFMEQHSWPGCLADLTACWASDGSDLTRRSIFSDFRVVEGEWLPRSGPHPIQASGPIGFVIPVRDDGSRVLVEVEGSLREHLADGTATGTNYEWPSTGLLDLQSGDDWWILLKGNRTRSLMTAEAPGVVHTLFGEDQIAEGDHWNMAAERTPDGFVAVVTNRAPEGGFTWAYYEFNLGDKPRLIGQGPELIPDPGGGVPIMTIRNAWLSLPEARSRWIRCEERHCELLDIDLTRVQMTSLSEHSFAAADRVALSGNRHVGCGVMEYVATQSIFETDAAGDPLVDEHGRWVTAESSLWMGRLAPPAGN